jgi:hypothetical protein
LELRQSHSREEAPEQAGLKLKAEGGGAKGTDTKETFSREIAVTQSMDSLFLDLERLGKVTKQ